MAIRRLQIRAQDIVLGMYVSGLDRPWSQTPFPLQGLHIKTPKDIEKIRFYSTYVYIDVTKGRSPSAGTKIYSTQTDTGEPETLEKISSIALEPRRADISKFTSIPPRPIEIREGVYSKTVPLRLEAAQAEKIVRELKGNLTLVSKQLSKARPVNFDALKGSVDAMVASVLRCPDAFNWLLRLRQKDQHSYDHSLRTSMLAAQFGRFAGMSKSDISVMCMGSLLKDVGKVKIPRYIVQKEHRNAEEEGLYRQFVQLGADILRTLGNVDPKVISVVRYHCERLDGSGFPQGVTGNKIPVLARIVGIASVYDAISNPRTSRHPVAPSKAVSLLYNMRGQGFQEDLVVKFIQSIGLYPTGTLVELTSGDLGVVIEQDTSSRLAPTVAVLDRGRADLGKGCLFINLKDESESRKILLESGRDDVMNVGKLAIARDLEPGTYDVDYVSISDAFLSNVALTEVVDPQRSPGLIAGLKRRLFS